MTVATADEEVALQARDDDKDDCLFRRPLTEHELEQVLRMAWASKCISDIIIGFFRGFILPAIGQDWEDYTVDRSLPTTRIKIPKSQWGTICNVLIERWSVQGGMIWMNVGPSSY